MPCARLKSHRDHGSVNRVQPAGIAAQPRIQTLLHAQRANYPRHGRAEGRLWVQATVRDLSPSSNVVLSPVAIALPNQNQVSNGSDTSTSGRTPALSPRNYNANGSKRARPQFPQGVNPPPQLQTDPTSSGPTVSKAVGNRVLDVATDATNGDTNNKKAASDDQRPGMATSSRWEGGEPPTGWYSRAFRESEHINNALLATNNLEQLLAVVTAKLDHMVGGELGAINMSTAVYRTTFFWRQIESSWKKQSKGNGTKPSISARTFKKKYVKPIFDLLTPHIIEKYQHGESIQAYDIAITLWSYATMDCYDSRLFTALTNRALTKLHQMSPTDCTHLMWACATIGHRSSLLIHELPLTAVDQIDEFKSQEIANFVWAMGRLKVHNRPMLRAASRSIRSDPSAFTTQDIVTTVYAFARLGHWDTPLLDTLSIELSSPHRLSRFVPQDLSNTVMAFSRLRYSPAPEVMDSFAETAIPMIGHFKGQEVSNLANGFGALQHCHGDLMDAIAERACSMRESMSNQELCVVLWALGKMEYHPNNDALDLIGEEFASRLPDLPALTISNMTKAFCKLNYFPPALPIRDILTHATMNVESFSMAELSNLVWAISQLQYYDETFFITVEDHVCENMHECSWHHVTSFVTSLRMCKWPAEALVSSARSCGFQV